MKKFLFLGGDLRMLYAAEYLNKGRECLLYGFDTVEELPVPKTEAIFPCDCAVLPLPVTADMQHINMPYRNGEKPDFGILKAAVKEGGTVFTSKSCPALEKVCAENNFKLVNYFQREELQLMNAVPTAEGALEIVLRELPVTVFGVKALITGFGRIGEVMARMLIALGADVTAAARGFPQQAKARGMGCRAVSTDSMEEILPEMQVVINTVPAPIFDKERLKLLQKDCLLIDLASRSGVGDMETAANAGVKVIWALSLPGRTAPVTAGRIIGKTIENMLAFAGEGEKNDGSV
ncbi:MAG: dipicolinate synthase subunit A [Firmicutes bacterium]|nr:dipicolinate synthase subunit A [Bacillota bacterium]